MNEIAAIRLLYDEFGVELINTIVDSTKECLGWNDFISDFSKYSNSTLIMDLLDVNIQLNNKKIQSQASLNDITVLSTLLNDIDYLSIRKKEITDQLCFFLNDLSSMTLS